MIGQGVSTEQPTFFVYCLRQIDRERHHGKTMWVGDTPMRCIARITEPTPQQRYLYDNPLRAVDMADSIARAEAQALGIPMVIAQVSGNGTLVGRIERHRNG